MDNFLQATATDELTACADCCEPFLLDHLGFPMVPTVSPDVHSWDEWPLEGVQLIWNVTDEGHAFCKACCG